MRLLIRWFLFLCLCFGGLNAFAEVALDKIYILALFKNKTMVEIDGRRHMLQIGDQSPEGVRLVKANSKQATFVINGRLSTLYPGGNAVQGNYKQPTDVRVQIQPDNEGMYTALGSIDGRQVRFMVDTGATMIALSSELANRIGIKYRSQGRPVLARTAAGDVHAFHVVLDSVKVGEIEIRNVDAAIVTGDASNPVLLGMSFLSRLHMENQGHSLVLSQNR